VTWATKLAGVSLVQERLDEAKVFYGDVFGLQAVHEDESNAVFKIGETVVHLLDVEAAPNLLGPGAIAAPSAGHRVQLRSRSTTSTTSVGGSRSAASAYSAARWTGHGGSARRTSKIRAGTSGRCGAISPEAVPSDVP
jgi:catechol 2,3-dioxygenase-like lactoylglutathione lyase family enzyme